MVNEFYALALSIEIMRIYFEEGKDAYSFLRLCKLIAYILEENEKLTKQLFLNALCDSRFFYFQKTLSEWFLPMHLTTVRLTGIRKLEE